MTLGLGQAVFNSLVENAERTAVIDRGRHFSYADLLRQSASLAASLRGHGLETGRVALFCLQNSFDVLLATLASWRLGATPLIADFRTPAAQRPRIADLAQAALLVESRRPAGEMSYDSVLWQDSWLDHAPGSGVPDGPIDCSAPGFLSLSSGTTGSPKLYVTSHAAELQRLSVRMHIARKTGLSFLTPLTMAFGATRSTTLSYLILGGTVYFEEPLFSASELIDMLLRNRVSGAALPPTIIRNIIKEVGERSQPMFPDLTMLRSIGGPATIEDKLAAYRNLTPGYLMSYSSGLTGQIAMLAGEDVINRPETVGRATAPATFEIVHPETLEVLRLGESGLIRVRTPYIADKVIESGPQEGNERFGPDWGIPGDIGVADHQGFLTIIGREADMIVRGGVTVAAQELESELKRHEAVLDAGVAGIEDDDYGQEIAAFIVSDTATDDDMHRVCMALFSPERRPRIIKIVKQLPYNANGKLVRSKLPELL